MGGEAHESTAYAEAAASETTETLSELSDADFLELIGAEVPSPAERQETIQRLTEHYNGQTFQYGEHIGTVADIIALCPAADAILDKGFDSFVAWIDSYKIPAENPPEEMADEEEPTSPATKETELHVDEESETTLESEETSSDSSDATTKKEPPTKKQPPAKKPSPQAHTEPQQAASARPINNKKKQPTLSKNQATKPQTAKAAATQKIQPPNVKKPQVQQPLSDHQPSPASLPSVRQSEVTQDDQPETPRVVEKPADIKTPAVTEIASPEQEEVSAVETKVTPQDIAIEEAFTPEVELLQVEQPTTSIEMETDEAPRPFQEVFSDPIAEEEPRIIAQAVEAALQDESELPLETELPDEPENESVFTIDEAEEVLETYDESEQAEPVATEALLNEAVVEKKAPIEISLSGAMALLQEQAQNEQPVDIVLTKMGEQFEAADVEKELSFTEHEEALLATHIKRLRTTFKTLGEAQTPKEHHQALSNIAKELGALLRLLGYQKPQEAIRRFLEYYDIHALEKIVHYLSSLVEGVSGEIVAKYIKTLGQTSYHYLTNHTRYRAIGMYILKIQHSLLFIHTGKFATE